MLDKDLFIYLTKKAGYTLPGVAAALDIQLSGLYARLQGRVEFRRAEMEAWMRMVGVTDAGPIFFPALVPKTEHGGVAAAGGCCEE